MLVPLQGTAGGRCCGRAVAAGLLQGAAARVVCALWVGCCCQSTVCAILGVVWPQGVAAKAGWALGPDDLMLMR